MTNDANQPKPATGVDPLQSQVDEGPGGVPETTAPEAERKSLWQRIEEWSHARQTSRESMSKERTRGYAVLAAVAVACVVLFVFLTSTSEESGRKQRGPKPNLGRPEQALTAQEAAKRHAVPQLSIESDQADGEPAELTEQDLLSTMRNRASSTPPQAEPGPPISPRVNSAPARTLGSIDFGDPDLTEAYRRRNLVRPAPQPNPSEWEQAIENYHAHKADTRSVAKTQSETSTNEALRQPSLVYVRTTAASGRVPMSKAIERVQRSLLPQGAAFVARIQYGVSSAAKAPVTAIIEYNYENDGVIVVPAGAKAHGELSNATPQGWVDLRFHALELPSGEVQEINASALDMQRQALRGDVSGRNTGKRFLTRALTGVGTIAAFAVGGPGLSGSLDNSVLLRERIASNVAMAGEQELSRLAYQQNIVVTLEANTRFYLVLHEPGTKKMPAAPLPIAEKPGDADPSTADIVRLRNEMREMDRLLQSSKQTPVPQP